LIDTFWFLASKRFATALCMRCEDVECGRPVSHPESRYLGYTYGVSEVGQEFVVERHYRGSLERRHALADSPSRRPHRVRTTCRTPRNSHRYLAPQHTFHPLRTPSDPRIDRVQGPPRTALHTCETATSMALRPGCSPLSTAYSQPPSSQREVPNAGGRSHLGYSSPSTDAYLESPNHLLSREFPEPYTSRTRRCERWFYQLRLDARSERAERLWAPITACSPRRWLGPRPSDSARPGGCRGWVGARSSSRRSRRGGSRSCRVTGCACTSSEHNRTGRRRLSCPPRSSPSGGPRSCRRHRVTVKPSPLDNLSSPNRTTASQFCRGPVSSSIAADLRQSVCFGILEQQ
jgi:hypothetical protein